MDGRAASLTVTDKLPYLLSCGVEPIVISAVIGKKDLNLEHYQLLAWGPAGIRFDFRHWFAARYGRGWLYKLTTGSVALILSPFIFLEKILFGYSNHWSWFIPAAIKAWMLIRRDKVELIYSTGGAWSAHYAAWVIKKFTGITWIAEIHDPMVIRYNPEDDGVAPRKNRDAKFLQKLEGLICRDSDLVWWFTEGAIDYARNRHPNLNDRGFVVYPGAEPPGTIEPLPSHHEYGDTLNLFHFGSLAENRSLEPILKGLDHLFEVYPQAKDRLKVQVYGGLLDSRSKLAIDRLGLQDRVMINGRVEGDPISGKTGRELIMGLMRKADVLLGIQGDFEWCAEYIPSKFYEYFWTNRPILAITNRNSYLDDDLMSRNHYVCHTLDETSILETLQDVWLDWVKKDLRKPIYRPISPHQSVEKILNRVKNI